MFFARPQILFLVFFLCRLPRGQSPANKYYLGGNPSIDDSQPQAGEMPDSNRGPLDNWATTSPYKTNIHFPNEPPHLPNEPPHISNEPPHISNEPLYLTNEPPHLPNEPPHLLNEPPHLP
jgi:pre-mRNA-processing factor 8